MEKCSPEKDECGKISEDAEKENIPELVKNENIIKTDEPPAIHSIPLKMFVEDVDEEVLTPLSKINLKWRRKSIGLYGNTSDSSVSTINHTTNSLTSMRKSPSSAKLVRTTSTPMTRMSQFLKKPRSLDSLCGSSYQASSIEHPSGNDTDRSASMTSIGITTPSPAIMKRPEFPIQRQNRNRLHVSQTPLRQLMSKSIQRALQEQSHRKNLNGYRAQRKMTFDSTSSSGSDNSLSYSPKQLSGVLDLRTTPVLKRTMSEPYSRNRRGYLKKPLIATVHPTEESLVLNALIDRPNAFQSPGSPVHEAQNPVDDNVINETKGDSEISHHHADANSSGSMLSAKSTSRKSDIFFSCASMNEFENTPVTKHKALVTPMQKTFKPLKKTDGATEVWYSPGNITNSFKIPTYSELQSPSSDKENDDVFVDDPHSPKSTVQPGRIWRIVTSVIRMATGALPDDTQCHQSKDDKPKESFVKRTLSLIRPKRSPIKKRESTPSAKRRRHASSQGTQTDESPLKTEIRSPLAKKYKTISGRKPIQRLRSSIN